MIIASDGVWDVLSSNDITNCILSSDLTTGA